MLVVDSYTPAGRVCVASSSGALSCPVRGPVSERRRPVLPPPSSRGGDLHGSLNCVGPDVERVTELKTISFIGVSVWLGFFLLT